MFSRHTPRLAAFIHTPILRKAPAYVIAVLLLCLPAVWNGFPLMFDDVGGYLERWPSASLGLGRSTVYGLVLWITRSMLFVPAIVLQAFVTVFVIDRAIKVFVPDARSQWLLAAAVAVLAAVSGVALFVSKPIPDAWAAPSVLALHLLAWHSCRLSNGARFVMAAIVAFAGASHAATFAVLAGMSAVHAAAKSGLPDFAKFMNGRNRQHPISAWLARRRVRLAPRGIGFAVVAVWSGLVLQAAGNFIVTGRIALNADGEIFLFARMIEDGMAGDVLSEECPRADWNLCQYRDALPSYAEGFLFNPDSPLQKIGGAYDPDARREIAAIVARSLVRHPLAHASRAFALTATQFIDAGTGGAMEPLYSDHTRTMLSRYAPSLIPTFDAARQQTSDIDVSGWSGWVVVPVSVAASLVLPLFAVLLWRRGLRREAALPALLFVSLLGNAAVCGVVASPNDRYQARLVWLAPLAAGLAGRALVRPSLPSPLAGTVGRAQIGFRCAQTWAAAFSFESTRRRNVTPRNAPPPDGRAGARPSPSSSSG
jgi:hypothetical protein